MQDWISVALPKGRLGEKAYDLFERIGYGCPSIREDNRKLIFENEEARVRYFWAKPSDVSIYVERGAADVGVAGKDILLEYAPDVYELNDLKMGRCRMMVAGQPGALEETGRKTEEKTEQLKEIIRQAWEETEKKTGDAVRKIGLKKPKKDEET